MSSDKLRKVVGGGMKAKIEFEIVLTYLTTLFLVNTASDLVLSGEYSCLQVDLLFAREVSYYIITIYLPTLMIVIVSWFSFWIDHKSVS